MDQNYQYLIEHGPCTGRELPTKSGSSPTTRENGMRVFKLPAGQGTRENAMGTNQAGVYYLDGRHAPVSVLRKWVDANESSVEHSPAWGLHQSVCRQYPEFKQASREVFGPFEAVQDSGSNESGKTDKPCPFCGDDDIDSFPRHRPDCPEL